jgi:predicted SnoaL-like aldol condensation-catalyzing enzyme
LPLRRCRALVDLNGEWSGKPQVFYDLFRVKNGKEHWDVIQETPTKGLANINGMFGFR